MTTAAGRPGTDGVPSTAEAWGAYLAARQEALQAMKDDIAAGVPAADAARRHGFATRRDVERHVERVIRTREALRAAGVAK